MGLDVISYTLAKRKAERFVGLVDTPNSYEGQATKVVQVKTDETGLEFVSAPAPGPHTYHEMLEFDLKTEDPTLKTSLLWFRDDLKEFRFSPDGSTVKTLFPPAWDDITNKPFNTLGSEFTVSAGELQVASVNFNKISNRLSSLLTFDSSIIPDTDNTYDIGSSDYRWRYVYVYDSVRFPNQYIEATTNYIRVLFPGTIAYDPFYVYATEVRTMHLRPLNDNLYKLGTADYKWAEGKIQSRWIDS